MNITLQTLVKSVNPSSMNGPQFLGFYLMLWLALILLTQLSKLLIRKLNFKVSHSTWGTMLTVPYLLLLVFGTLRVIHGLMIDKPVGFLVLLMLATGINMLMLISKEGASGN